MDYLHALRLIHATAKPRNYVEIGARRGASLSLARCPSIAVDPDFEIVEQIEAPVRLYKKTSDDFFDQHDLVNLLGDEVDLAFIDGMHNAEYVLRDFVNLEAAASQHSLIVIDDVLPQEIGWTTRQRQTQAWTGDVYKIIPFLRRERPDLRVDVFDIAIKGLAVITNLNPADHVLRQSLSDHVAELSGTSCEIGSIEELRDLLAPHPASELEAFVATVTADRAPSPTRKRHLETESQAR